MSHASGRVGSKARGRKREREWGVLRRIKARREAGDVEPAEETTSLVPPEHVRLEHVHDAAQTKDVQAVSVTLPHLAHTAHGAKAQALASVPAATSVNMSHGAPPLLPLSQPSCAKMPGEQRCEYLARSSPCHPGALMNAPMDGSSWSVCSFEAAAVLGGCITKK